VVLCVSVCGRLSVLVLEQLTQAAHLEHVEIAAVQLDNTLETVNTQQLTSQLMVLTNDHLHLRHTCSHRNH